MPTPDRIHARDPLRSLEYQLQLGFLLLDENPTKVGTLNAGPAEMLGKFIAAGFDSYGDSGP